MLKRMRWIVGVLLILGLAVELALRTLIAWYHLPTGWEWLDFGNRLAYFGDRDLYRGFIGKKGMEFYLAGGTTVFNDLGFRSTSPHIGPKEEKQLRVACFGDSVTFSPYSKSFRDTWPGQLEEIIAEALPDRKVEAINFGMAHYTHVINLVNMTLLDEYVRPDMNIFMPGPNDVAAIFHYDCGPDGSGSGALYLPLFDLTWGVHPLQRIIIRSKVFATLYWIGVAGGYLQHLNTVLKPSLEPEAMTLRMDYMKNRLSTMNRLSESGGADMLFCKIVKNDNVIYEVRTSEWIEASEAINKALTEVSEETGAILVDATPEMNDVPEYFTDDYHLTNEGNNRLAQIIFDSLRREGVLGKLKGPDVPDVSGAGGAGLRLKDAFQ
ncbi:SGNH/GDSL hydrolase family protein [Thermodesulfobacteriota bacterium]